MSPHASKPSRPVNINVQILAIMIFNFANYLTIGLPLAVLPGYVHDSLGFSAFWAGVAISMQYFATLISRPHAGRYADVLGPKKVVLIGLFGCLLSGVFYLVAVAFGASPAISLALLCVGRLVLGVGQSFAGTGSTLWGIGRVGSLHIGKVISWSGVVTYGAMAIGAPLGVWIVHLGGLASLSLCIIGIALAALLLAMTKPDVAKGTSTVIPFRQVLGKVLPYGLVLGLASTGFGVIATFITLFYAAKGWSGGAFALTLFSTAFVGMRLLFPNSINRFGGQRVAMVCFCFETLGLLLVWCAAAPLMALLGAMLTGAGFSLVFPALGVVAVKRLPQQNQGSALATYTAFMDLSLGITGPLAGILMTHAGVSSIYLASAFAVCLSAALVLRRVKKEKSWVTE
ncbi:MFS transporter [Rouxiella badensis]|uniref:MFS transporter n=1 Tax=Rouxiella badensis TaxID=1646377 RepID=UPI001B67A4EB|nr:MFS transporter [Rouxiella badensis]MCC3702781.1 MFS transporter [Rouxiella badensis]MCC3748272.1 MFS transporter [Rouxiella badensis]